MPKRGYHHGNLREALINGCLSLIEKRGPTGFTLSEAAREAGVTPAAVYRHFEGREDLLLFDSDSAEFMATLELGSYN